MTKLNIVTSAEAVQLVGNDKTVGLSGYLSYGLPETLCKALEKRFLETGAPKGLTLYYSSPVGVTDGSGIDRLAHEGLVKRVIGGHYNLHPAIARLALDNKIEAYSISQGIISRLTRDAVSHGPGVITHVGLNTFLDPRINGGKVNEITKDDFVEIIEIDGKEWMRYKPVPLDVAFIRGDVADARGNVSIEDVGIGIDVTSLAQAVHNNGGKVIVQVGRIDENIVLDPWKVRIPGMLVDAFVLPDSPEDQVQCRVYDYDASITSAERVPMEEAGTVPLDARKVVTRRAAMELKKDVSVNLGIGMPEYVAKVAAEEGFTDVMTLSVESGAIGGTPRSGGGFGANINVEAIIDQSLQFDYYDGGGLDQTYLGMAQADAAGNANVSFFNGRLAGVGGFIDISQNAHQVTFCGTFTAGGLKIETGNGELKIVQEGKNKKFVNSVDQISFSAEYAVKTGQPVMFVTERAVFRITEKGLTLTEIAPGVDLEKDVLQQMEFKPVIADDLKLMDARIFRDEPMGLEIN